MGMYDTFRFSCPKCGEETDPQTKLGEQLLDNWRLGDRTTMPDGEYRMKDECYNCGHYSTVTIKNGIFKSVSKEPSSNALQEVGFGDLKPLGTCPKEEIKRLADIFRKAFDK